MDKDGLENEFLAILLQARKKGMSSRQFFHLVEATLKHQKGVDQDTTLSKVIDNTATSEEVEILISRLDK